MKKIDKETVQRILDTADIVEVVSDFVTLKRRGANYIGLCPFHNERTPSFSVSKSKGICKCFSCGKGGSPVNFIMEIEQMTYQEALRYLARKYNIEIREHEVSDAEREAESQRESLLAVNNFALKHFEYNIAETADGRDIGAAYFRERGISDLMIKKFHLGYALDRPDDLLKAALKEGFSEDYLVETGLCARNDRGTVYDKYKGRVIYPIFSVSGRVIGFGGRTLRSDKNIAKYINSPASPIYDKSRELYGLYQAKQAIAKRDKCILVEGYMDVISMHQAGVENVVASSGTSLTEGQIRLIHRFTNNITVIYDSDAAGIKASLRGIDMLLAEGMNIKVLLLPDGDDPDSFAQSHSSTEVEAYLDEHEVDFISFKTSILLQDAKNDPTERSKVITSIVESIACIPDPVTRDLYIQECSRTLGVKDTTLALQLQNIISRRIEKGATQRRGADEQPQQVEKHHIESASPRIEMAEQTLISYVLKYGLLNYAADIDNPEVENTVLDYINADLEYDSISLTNPTYAFIYEESRRLAASQWEAARAAKEQQLREKMAQDIKDGIDKIRQEGGSIGEMEARERMMRDELAEKMRQELDDYSCQYLFTHFLSHPDDNVRRVATDLVAERHKLSKVHTKYAHVETERERLSELVPRAIYELKDAILDTQVAELQKRLSQVTDNGVELISDIMKLIEVKKQIAQLLGERVVNRK